MAKRKGGLSEADRALWRKVTDSIDPLTRREAATVEQAVPAAPVASPRPKSAKPKPARPAKVLAAGSPLPMGKVKPVPPKAPPGAGLDRKSAERLRRGKYPIEGTLDLHGLTVERAHRRLDSFIAQSRAAGKRAVLVITGKGRAGGEGILRRQVPFWLAEGENSHRVLAVRTAQPSDGGEGALYVLLRRDRPGR